MANLPITVYPGMKIGQISFLRMTTPAEHPYGSAGLGSKYQGSGAPPPAGTSRTSVPDPPGGDVAHQDHPRHGRDRDRLRHRRAPLRLSVSPGRARVGPTPTLHRPPGPALGRAFRGRGQRKLLRWTVPGIAHAFTFWGFTILLFTILEAYGDLFDARLLRAPHRPGPGARPSSRTSSPWPCSCRCASSPSSASSTPPSARPAVALLRLAHRGGVAGARHDRLGHDHADRLPRRPDQHRQLPLRQLVVALRLPRRVPPLHPLRDRA